MKDNKSVNYTILKQLMSKSKKTTSFQEFDYIIIYAFLYKFCSDTLKNYLTRELKNQEFTIDDVYKNTDYTLEITSDSLKINGFFIEKPDAFIEKAVNNNYSKPGFLRDFLKIFPENTIFSAENNINEYFSYLFKTIDSEIDTNKFDTNINLHICEIINLISQLDVYDTNFHFREVFEIFSSSPSMHVESNPDYITQILTELILTYNNKFESVYDPFLKDASSLMKLDGGSFGEIKKFYGKDMSKVNFIYSFADFYINNISLDNVYLKNEDASKSADIGASSFDVILSRIPIAIKNYYSSNVTHSIEISKRNKRSEIENILLNNLDIDENSFKQDIELNQALENLVDKINHADDFTGEYESLKDSEFLFLISLADLLNDEGIMAVSISENFLFKESLKILRKYLIFNKNYIDAVIRIPNEIDRSRPEVVIVFKKNRSEDNILFIDMSSDYNTQKRTFSYPEFFGKSLVVDDETIAKLKNVFQNRLALPKFSNLISLSQIMDNDFYLSVSRYVDTYDGEFYNIDDLILEKKEIKSNIDDLNLKIEKMMDDLNIDY